MQLLFEVNMYVKTRLPFYSYVMKIKGKTKLINGDHIKFKTEINLIDCSYALRCRCQTEREAETHTY